jgi:transposase, IS4 family
VTRSNLSKANTNRDYRIFEEYAYYLVSEARRKRATDIFKLDGNVYAFDSTTISLCLDVFWWAKFRKHKGGIKIHTLYDLETQIPAFFHITTASVHDSKAMKEIPIETGAYYIFIVATTISKNFIAYIVRSRFLLSGLRPICSTSVSIGNAECPREYGLMQR